MRETLAGDDGTGERASGGCGMNEELSLLVAAANTGLYPKMRPGLSVNDFRTPEAKELLIILEEEYKTRPGGPMKLPIEALLAAVHQSHAQYHKARRGIEAEHVKALRAKEAARGTEEFWYGGMIEAYKNALNILSGKEKTE
jgi:hypothetical protein